MRYLFYFNTRLYKFINDHTTYATQTPTSLTVSSKSDPNKHSKIVHEIIPFHNSKQKKRNSQSEIQRSPPISSINKGNKRHNYDNSGMERMNHIGIVKIS